MRGYGAKIIAALTAQTGAALDLERGHGRAIELIVISVHREAQILGRFGHIQSQILHRLGADDTSVNYGNTMILHRLSSVLVRWHASSTCRFAGNVELG